MTAPQPRDHRKGTPAGWGVLLLLATIVPAAGWALNAGASHDASYYYPGDEGSFAREAQISCDEGWPNEDLPGAGAACSKDWDRTQRYASWGRIGTIVGAAGGVSLILAEWLSKLRRVDRGPRSGDAPKPDPLPPTTEPTTP